MIRVLIREVQDHRVRASKSLGVADIEQVMDLPANATAKTQPVHIIRFYSPNGSDTRVLAKATFTPDCGPHTDPWTFLHNALDATPPPAPLPHLAEPDS
jgi:hypothetical protein